MVWYAHLLKNFPKFVVIHTVKGFGIVNNAEVDVFLERSCFFDAPTDIGNLISGSSAFSKCSLNICKFTVHVLLKPWRIFSITLLAWNQLGSFKKNPGIQTALQINSIRLPGNGDQKLVFSKAPKLVPYHSLG